MHQIDFAVVAVAAAAAADAGAGAGAAGVDVVGLLVRSAGVVVGVEGAGMHGAE